MVAATVALIGLSGVAASSVAIVSLLQLEGRAIKFVAVLLIASVEIVALAQALSVASAFGRIPMTMATTIIAILALLRTRLQIHLTDVPTIKNQLRRTLDQSRRMPAATLAAIIAGVLLSVEFVIALFVAPNTVDSMTYHLTRAAYWVQNHSIAQFENGTVRQNAFPVNAEIIQGWTIMLTRGDRIVQLVQWLAQLGAAAAIFSLARELKFECVPSMFASFAFIGMPVVIAQSTSSQNDLIVTFFVLAAMLFLVRFTQSKDVTNAAFAAVAVGLAVGTKVTALILAPSLALAAFILLGPARRTLLSLALAMAVGVLTLGSFSYVQNLWHEGSINGESSQNHVRISSASDIPANMLRLAWSSAFDMPGISSVSIEQGLIGLAKPALGWIEDPGRAWYEEFSLDFNHFTSEDRVGFGLVGIGLILPSLLVAIWRRRRPDIALSVFALSGFVAIACLLKYNVWMPRLLLPAVAVAVVLVAHIARREGGRVLTIVIVVASAVPMAIDNGNKPLGVVEGRPNALTMSRMGQIAIPDPGPVEAAETVNRHVSTGGAIGVVASEDTYVYPLFGPRFERRVVPLGAFDLDPGMFDRFGIEAVLVAESVSTAPPKMNVVDAGNGHFLALPQRQSR